MKYLLFLSTNNKDTKFVNVKLFQIAHTKWNGLCFTACTCSGNHNYYI